MFAKDNINGGSRQVEVDGFAGGLTVVTTDHTMIHAGKAYTLSGTLSVATTKSGAIQLRTGDTAATKTVDMTAASSDLTYTAVANGAAGNLISVTHVDPGGVTAALAVTVVGTAITVSLARTASAISSTAALVKAAVNASPEAAALVTCEDEGDGTGLVNALAIAYLAGGTDHVHCHFKPTSITTSGGPATVSLLEDYSMTLTGASVLTPMNRKRSGDVGVSQITCYGIADAAVSGGSAAKTLDVTYIAGASLGATKLGGSTAAAEEWLLKPSTNYVLAFSNGTTGGGAVTLVIGFEIYWYEEPMG